MMRRAVKNQSKLPCYKISLVTSKHDFLLTKKQWIELAEAFIGVASLKNYQRVILVSIDLSRIDIVVNLIDNSGDKWINHVPHIFYLLHETERNFGIKPDRLSYRKRDSHYHPHHPHLFTMRTKCSCATSFRTTLSYVLGKKESTLIATNIPVRSVDTKEVTNEIIKYMTARSQNRGAKKSCYHVSISPADKDIQIGISHRKWIDISESFTQKIGLEDNQRVYVIHEDTGRPHLHCVFNLINRNGKISHLHNNYYQNQAALKEIEKEFNLEETWSKNHWLRTTSSNSSHTQEHLNNHFRKYRLFLEDFNLNDLFVGDYRLILNNNHLGVYGSNSNTIPLISAHFTTDRWLIEHKNTQQELLIFQQLDKEIQNYLKTQQFQKRQTKKSEIEL
ncbi:relaxase/mobilization nuclease domain-containing protein [Okeania sp. SIO2B3]|uniref:relaxase/mobilization nuclease domain-containing protein n=1 Tax=Okeania sp. SIO2B3 TaxID=2607784 RepID=UPI0025F0553B|nr:relaxase/mobilization nuclease domain-containing protein [Okeania sp. SIO2B3]